MSDIIYGYKAFNKGLINRYGKQYELNKLYRYEGELKFGNDGHGFHMCENLEDCLRFFDDSVEVTSVMGFGNIIKRDDDYNGMYDMYVTEYMIINEVLSREDIINYMLNVNNENRLRIFFSLFKLSDCEKNKFAEKYGDSARIMNDLKYHQYGEKDAWNNYYKRKGLLK